MDGGLETYNNMSRRQDDTPIGRVPRGTEAIIIDPTMMCEKHLEMGQDWDIPAMNLIFATQGALVGSEDFFEIAYRKLNGYSKPEEIEWNQVPDGEQPGIKHINEAMEEIGKICCFVEEHVENPYPDEDVPEFIAIIAEHAREEEEDG